jgi:hypothetical protein
MSSHLRAQFIRTACLGLTISSLIAIVGTTVVIFPEQTKEVFRLLGMT